MKAPRVTLDQWRTLQAVVDHGGFAQAAEALHRSQSSVSYTVARMQDHPGANIPPGELERITASLLVVRCARCHGEETLNLMVLKTQPERIATIRRMAALPGSGVRSDQVLAIAQAFEKLIDEGDRGGPNKSTASSAAPIAKP